MVKKKGRRGGFTIPLGVVMPLAVNFLEPARQVLGGNPVMAARQIGDMFTGYDMGDWSRPWMPNAPMKFYGMLLFGVIMHKLVGRVVNPILGRAKVPIVRI